MRGYADAVLREALALTEEERAEIAGVLLESLEPVPEIDVEAAWRQEVGAVAMDKEKRARLEAHGWRVGTAEEFLGLTPEEAAYVELSLMVSPILRPLRNLPRPPADSPE